jgi:hypothetical protein
MRRVVSKIIDLVRVLRSDDQAKGALIPDNPDTSNLAIPGTSRIGTVHSSVSEQLEYPMRETGRICMAAMAPPRLQRTLR